MTDEQLGRRVAAALGVKPWCCREWWNWWQNDLPGWIATLMCAEYQEWKTEANAYAALGAQVREVRADLERMGVVNE